MKKSFISLAAFSAAGALALSGCVVNDSASSGSSESGSSDSITVACGAMEDLCQKWTETFTQQTGIKATYVRLSSGETVARLDSAKDNPEFDVWHGGPVDGYGAAAEKGLIRPPLRKSRISTRTRSTTGPVSTSVFWASARTRRFLKKRASRFPSRGMTFSSPNSRARFQRHTPRPRELRSRHCGPRLFFAVVKTQASTT